MSEHIDHKAAALRWADSAWKRGGPDGDVLIVTDAQREQRLATAQIHATLYLAEQQRIANLIALSGAGHEVLSEQPALDAVKQLVSYRPHEDADLGGWFEFKPEIKKALGLS